MKYLSIGIRALLTLAFFAAGSAKLLGAEMMVGTFEAVGFGQWFRYLTGIIEFGGAIALWFAATRVYAAALLGATMVGAVVAHLTVLGPSAVPAVVLGLLLVAVLYLHRDEVAVATGKVAST